MTDGANIPQRAALVPPLSSAGEAGPAHPAAGRRGVHMLVIAGIVGAGLAGLAVQPVMSNGHAEIAFLGFTLPSVCWFRFFTGLSCAGCGLTRSVVFLLHGHPATSFTIHPFGIAAVALAALQLPPRIAGAIGSQAAWVSRWDRKWGLAVCVTAAAMLGRWVLQVGIVLVFLGFLWK